VSLTAREEVQFLPLRRRIIGMPCRGTQGVRGRLVSAPQRFGVRSACCRFG
jgi:hypothetical protein